MKNLILFIFTVLLFTACGQDEQVFPSSGSFEIQYEGDQIYLHSIAKAPHDGKSGGKEYDIETLDGYVLRMSDPTCGKENRKEITIIEYESGVDNYGNSFRNSGTHKLVDGEKIIAKDVYFEKSGLDVDPTEDILQITIINL